SRLFEKAMSNVVEVKITVDEVQYLTTQDHIDKMGTVANGLFAIPDTDELLLPSLGVAPLQLLAYYIALMRGCDIDKPRNLAKSVTVE
ncbi:MAG: glutamine--fructose-6-phosphate aminotransferase, partial [Oscillospiraceae bacterium]|nr:glutamine--fructose-6-phosphate aminotransferase [Oscillospiraceae bacterium]